MATYYKLKQSYLDKLQNAFNSEVDCCATDFRKLQKSFMHKRIKQIDNDLNEIHSSLHEGEVVLDNFENSESVKTLNAEWFAKIFRYFKERKIESAYYKALEICNVAYLTLLKDGKKNTKRNKNQFVLISKCGNELINVLSELRFCPEEQGVTLVADFQTFTIDISNTKEKSRSATEGDNLDLEEPVNFNEKNPLILQSVMVNDFVYVINGTDYTHKSNLPQPTPSDYEECERGNESMR